MKIIDGVYCYPWRGLGHNCNTYALEFGVDGKKEYALVDPGFHFIHTQKAFGRGARISPPAPATDKLIASLSTDGIRPEQVRLIILTHGHPDHVDSGPWWREQFGIPVALHAADLHFYQRLPSTPHASWSGKPIPVLTPDIYLQEGDFALGDSASTVVQILRVPGHSPGSVAIYHPKVKALITGDVVFYRMAGRPDTPGGNIADLRDSIHRLAGLDVEYLLPGHTYLKSDFIAGLRQVQENFDYVINRRLTSTP